MDTAGWGLPEGRGTSQGQAAEALSTGSSTGPVDLVRWEGVLGGESRGARDKEAMSWLGWGAWKNGLAAERLEAEVSSRRGCV